MSSKLFILVILTLFGFISLVHSMFGGKSVTDHRYPFMVKFVERDTKLVFCSGSILTESLILTAAHCVEDNSDISNTIVVAGSYNFKLNNEDISADLKECKLHPEYFLHKNSYHDIAICKLKTSFKFNDRIKPVKLRNNKLENVSIGKNVKLIGWGDYNIYETVPEQLQHADLIILNSIACIKQYSDYRNPLAICAGNKNNIGPTACHGDSGGVLLYGMKQIGITLGVNECMGEPSTFVSIKVFYDWIKDTRKQYEDDDKKLLKKPKK